MSQHPDTWTEFDYVTFSMVDHSQEQQEYRTQFANHRIEFPYETVRAVLDVTEKEQDFSDMTETFKTILHAGLHAIRSQFGLA